MKTWKLIFLFLLFLVGIGVFAWDYFLTKAETWKEVFQYMTAKHTLLWMVDIPKAVLKDDRLVLDKEIKLNEVQIPINKLKFYQDQYQMIPNVVCDEYSELQLERNYQLMLSTYENTKILNWVKMFDLKYNENPDGNVTSWTKTTDDEKDTTDTKDTKDSSKTKEKKSSLDKKDK